MIPPAQNHHLIKKVLLSTQPLMTWMRRIFVILLVILGLAGVRFGLFSLTQPNIYHKDFMQEYLMGKAVLEGLDPYLPLPELGSRFLGSLPQINLPHPTPHPPPVILIGMLFSFISYESAATIWFFFEIALIGWSAYLILRINELKVRPVKVLLLTCIFLAFRPFIANLGYGQLMTVLLVLLIGGWHHLRKGKDLSGGILIGAAMAIKLVAWPLVLFLLVQKKWLAVAGATLTFLAANLIAGWVVGFQRLADYYLKVSASVTPLYRGHEGNFSLFTIGYRLFEGTGSPGLSGMAAPPLVSQAELAAPTSIALVSLFLLFSVWLAVGCRSFDAAYSLIVCSSLLLSPIFWVVYLILTVIPMAYVSKRLVDLDYPRLESWMALGLLVFLMGPREIMVGLLSWLPHEIAADTTQEFSFSSSLVSWLPMLAMFLLIWLVRRVEHGESDVTGIGGEGSQR